MYDLSKFNMLKLKLTSQRRFRHTLDNPNANRIPNGNRIGNRRFCFDWSNRSGNATWILNYLIRPRVIPLIAGVKLHLKQEKLICTLQITNYQIYRIIVDPGV